MSTSSASTHSCAALCERHIAAVQCILCFLGRCRTAFVNSAAISSLSSAKDRNSQSAYSVGGGG